jgi:tRNA dimethylallyltransferase
MTGASELILLLLNTATEVQDIKVIISDTQALDARATIAYVHPLVAIVGPTGSGKSALASYVARRLRGEIVNCDSLQLYRYFDIGTAKVPVEERRAIPHHLIDIIEPDQVFSAGEYARVARGVLREIAARGNVPVIVGGTGFYLRALLDGLFDGPKRDEPLRARLVEKEQRRPSALHRILRRLDPAAAARIHANDLNKLIRALEICIQARCPLSELHAAGTPALEGFMPYLIGLDPPREALYEVLNSRCTDMFDQGLIGEVESILARGYSENVKPFESLGYKQVLLLLNGKYTFSSALEEMQKGTRRYAKRQLTWFKKDTRVTWIPGFGHSPETKQNTIETLVTLAPELKKYFS